LSQDRRKKYAVISEGFVKTNFDLQRRSFDVNFSGSTAISVICTGKNLICSNVGDSRAVLGSLRDKSEVSSLKEK
jgi:serine/threonine protein phosphatase PrpC